MVWCVCVCECGECGECGMCVGMGDTLPMSVSVMLHCVCRCGVVPLSWIIGCVLRLMVSPAHCAINKVPTAQEK